MARREDGTSLNSRRVKATEWRLSNNSNVCSVRVCLFRSLSSCVWMKVAAAMVSSIDGMAESTLSVFVVVAEATSLDGGTDSSDGRGKVPTKVEVNANDRCRREMKKANRHTVMMVIGCKDGSV